MDLGAAVLRVFVGLSLALAHGWGKMPPSDKFIEGVGDMGFPLPTVFAWSASLSELVGGVLLALGLLTWPAAFFVFVTMAVAAFVVHGNDPFQTRELALLYGAVALMFLFTGAGRFSVDRLIR